MDTRLVAWARSVKARRGARWPTLWLFTDAARLPDPRAAIARLPRGLAGVVFRHDDAVDRARLGHAIARLCRSRRLALSVAGDWRLAARLRAGVHARQGRRPAGMPRWLPLLTASAHGTPALLRARRAGALAFLSPAFATASHPGAPALGAVRWSGLARTGGAGALGGIDGRRIRRLSPASCVAAAAINALG